MYEKVERQTELDSDVEEEMKNLILLIKECIGLKNQEDGIRKIHDKLHPANWSMKEIELPRVDYPYSSEWKHLENLINRMMSRFADRDGSQFPLLEDSLLDSSAQRLALYPVCEQTHNNKDTLCL